MKQLMHVWKLFAQVPGATVWQRVVWTWHVMPWGRQHKPNISREEFISRLPHPLREHHFIFNGDYNEPIL